MSTRLCSGRIVNSNPLGLNPSDSLPGQRVLGLTRPSKNIGDGSLITGFHTVEGYQTIYTIVAIKNVVQDILAVSDTDIFFKTVVRWTTTSESVNDR